MASQTWRWNSEDSTCSSGNRSSAGKSSIQESSESSLVGACRADLWAIFTAALTTAYAWMRVDVREYEQYFEDRAALLERGGQRSGWLPANLPVSARFIHEVHDLTSKDTLSSFHVSDPMEFQKYVVRLQNRSSPGPATRRAAPSRSYEIRDPRNEIRASPTSWPCVWRADPEGHRGAIVGARRPRLGDLACHRR